ncbi:MAG: molybdenum cofactor biosynthesis protein B [Thermosynechococcaceae cyanobacterium]
MMRPHPHADAVPRSVCCAVVTVSDRRFAQRQSEGGVSAEALEDTSGQWIQMQLEAAGHRVVNYDLLPDEPTLIREKLQQLASQGEVQVAIFNGGTGIAPRDTTYDAIAGLLDKELPGFGELFRALSYLEIGSRAIASRATAGVCGHLLVFSLPGSTAAVALAMEKLILPELGHLTQLLQT